MKCRLRTDRKLSSTGCRTSAISGTSLSLKTSILDLLRRSRLILALMLSVPPPSLDSSAVPVPAPACSSSLRSHPVSVAPHWCENPCPRSLLAVLPRPPARHPPCCSPPPPCRRSLSLPRTPSSSSSSCRPGSEPVAPTPQWLPSRNPLHTRLCGPYARSRHSLLQSAHPGRTGASHPHSRGASSACGPTGIAARVFWLRCPTPWTI